MTYYKKLMKTNEKLKDVSDKKYDLTFITEKSQSIVVEADVNDTTPIKFNYNTYGFYIVNYPTDMWEQWVRLFKNKADLDQTNLQVQDKTQLLYDAFRLAQANLLPFETALELTSILGHSRAFEVWYVGDVLFNQMWPYFKTTDLSGVNHLMTNTFKTYATSLVANHYQEYSIQKNVEDIITQRLQQKLVSFACQYGLDQCLLEAQVEFKKWRYDEDYSIPANVLSTVFRYAIQESNDENDWHHLWDVYNQTTFTVLKLNYLEGLAQTSNRALLKL